MDTANTRPLNKNEKILVVSHKDETINSIVVAIDALGHEALIANDEEQAIELFRRYRVAYVLIEANSEDSSYDRLVKHVRSHDDGLYTPVLILIPDCPEEKLSSYHDSGCDDCLFKPFDAISLNARITSLGRIRSLKHLYKNTVNEQLVAKGILSGALEGRCVQFDEISVLRKSKSVFSGDLFLTARHPDGSLNVLLADFTGHGLSAAIGALPVADAFGVMTEKGFGLDYILKNINNKLYTLLPTSMFMACSALSIASDLAHVKVWNGGMPDIYVRATGVGDIRYKIKSSHIPLGIDKEVSDHFEPEIISLTPGDQIVMFTDGLTDAMNSDKAMFGDVRLEQCITDAQQEVSVFQKILDTFSNFCGEVLPQDDVTLACIPCTSSLMDIKDSETSRNMEAFQGDQDCDWCWYIELGGGSLHVVNPIPVVINEVHNLSNGKARTEKLSTIMDVLYQNVIACKPSGSSIVNHDIAHEGAGNGVIGDNAYMRIGIVKLEYDGKPALLVQLQDNGKVITNDKLTNYLDNVINDSANTRIDNIPLLYELNTLPDGEGVGNHFEAIVC